MLHIILKEFYIKDWLDAFIFLIGLDDLLRNCGISIGKINQNLLNIRSFLLSHTGHSLDKILNLRRDRRPATYEQAGLIEHDSEREDVCFKGIAFSLKEFWSHVTLGSHLSTGEAIIMSKFFRESKVSEFGSAINHHQNVFEFQIPMKNVLVMQKLDRQH